MENNTVQNVVHGFKVFRPDWTCDPTGYNPKQYTCPGKFEEEPLFPRLPAQMKLQSKLKQHFPM